MRMNAADTSASSAIADWTPLTVVSRSRTTAEIDTFISDVSTTSTNIAIASRIASRGVPVVSSGTPLSADAVIAVDRPRAASRAPWCARYSSHTGTHHCRHCDRPVTCHTWPSAKPPAGASRIRSVDERTARGKAARADVHDSSHAAWEPPGDRLAPVDLLLEQAADGCRSSSRSARADARVAVRVLPRRGRADGRRSRADAAFGPHRSSCAAMRTCRTSAASPRPTASSCSTSTTSTRPRAVPGSGTSSGSRRASRSPAASSA